MKNPQVGDIVLFRMHEAGVEEARHRADHDPYAHRNPVIRGQQYPLLVTALFGDDGKVQGQVFLDGNFTLWATSVPRGPGEREYELP